MNGESRLITEDQEEDRLTNGENRFITEGQEEMHRPRRSEDRGEDRHITEGRGEMYRPRHTEGREEMYRPRHTEDRGYGRYTNDFYAPPLGEFTKGEI